MSEKFRQIVATPEQAAAKLRKIIESKKPAEYVRRMRDEKNAVNDAPGKADDVIDALEIAGLGAVKGAAWLAAGGAQFLLTVARWMTMDNQFIRQMENKFAVMNIGKNKKNKPKKLSSWAKKYPNLSAHLLWMMGLVALGTGGYVTAEYGPDAVQYVKEQRAYKQQQAQARGTYRAFLDKMRPITPFMIADLIAKEGVHVNDQGMHTPYYDSQGIPTIGFGSTVLKDGSRVTMNTPPITTAEAYELARWHLEEGETYFVLYCYDTGLENINIDNTQQALGMSSLIYNAYGDLIERPSDKNYQNRFATLRAALDEYGFAVPDTVVRDAFKKYPVDNVTSFGDAWIRQQNVDAMADKLGEFLAGGRGIQWRRWLEAGLLTGDITPQMMLDCPVNGMYEFYKFMNKKKSAFFSGGVTKRQVNSDTYKIFKQWLAHPVTASGVDISGWKKVQDFLPDDILAYCKQGECEIGNKKFANLMAEKEPVVIKTYVLDYDTEYQNAIETYQQADYDSAAKKFEKMVAQYSHNALLRNDLAATYNKLGRYNDAIAQARVVLRQIGDKSQYAAAQYNAGVAYEKLGNLDRALMNYKLAVANGNSRVSADVQRVQKKISHGKTISFNDAIKLIQKDGYVHDLGVYSVLNNSNKVG